MIKYIQKVLNVFFNLFCILLLISLQMASIIGLTYGFINLATKGQLTWYLPVSIIVALLCFSIIIVEMKNE